MPRSFFRRPGAVFLLLSWAQVATANALPCGIACLLEIDTAHHHHAAADEDHAIGHHIAGPKVSAPENCGTPQLLVATFVPPDFPAPPSFTVAVSHVEPVMVAPVRSIAPSFDTPPPRV